MKVNYSKDKNANYAELTKMFTLILIYKFYEYFIHEYGIVYHYTVVIKQAF